MKSIFFIFSVITFSGRNTDPNDLSSNSSDSYIHPGSTVEGSTQLKKNYRKRTSA